MAPVFKKLLRDVLDHASTGGNIMLDDGSGMFDEEIDEEEEMSQQRLRIPGSHSEQVQRCPVRMDPDVHNSDSGRYQACVRVCKHGVSQASLLCS